MNAFTPILSAPEPVGRMRHNVGWVDHASRAKDQADTLIASLALVPELTDFPCTVALADHLTRRARWYGNNGDTGMLGRNGIEPAVQGCVESAARHGFGWREGVVL